MDARRPFRLNADQLLPLTHKSDARGLARALGHLGAIATSTGLLWAAHGTLWALPLTLLQGYLLAFLFNALHETAHQTALRRRAANLALGHLAGFAILLPYEYYRAFHWDHHRYTQDPERDPELFVPPPASRLALAWTVGGVPTWIGRVRMLFMHGVLGRVGERWIAADKRALIVAEARCYLLGYAVVIAASLAAQTWAALWLWLLPLVAGQWLLRPYLLAEHTGCAHSTDMLANTRTTLTNAVVRYFAWNMPYHAEHHAYPAVPFHALPRLHTLLAGRIVHVAPGYRSAARAVLRHVDKTSAAQAAHAADA
ncbi:MAG: fatty acid desaturase [Rubrivivax sp.]